MTFWLSNIIIKSSDKAASYAPIKVNQVGYPLIGGKYALVSGYYNELTVMPGTPFQVRNASNRSIAYSGELSLVSAYDASSGEKVLKADFSGLTAPGDYVLTVDGIAEPSAAFQIGDGSIYSTLLKDVQKFFYFQRANEDLLAEHAGIFARTGDRKEDHNLPFQSDPTTTKDVSGGWWDAGDLGKYVTVGATAISDLLWAYESFPGQFQDHSLNIPESGNGIPDLLDEIKVETDFILKMQDEATGGFYGYVIRDHAPNRYIMDGTASNRLIPTFHTGAAVGALAHAYIVMKDVPELAGYAETLKAAALRGWNYLEEHPEFIPQPSGPYDSTSDVNDRFYAAATLYRATGEQVYNDYVVAHYLEHSSIFEQETFSHNIGSLQRIGLYHYMMGEQPNAAVKTWFTDKFVQWRDILINANMNKSVWGNSTLDGFYWGANSNNAGIPVGLAIGSRILGLYNEQDLKVAADNLNYLLGINPLQMSYITGHGERRVTKTIHEVYNSDYLLEMPSGYMPGGPNNNGRYTFNAKAYNGSSIDWETNEQALNYNSPLTYLVALLTESNSAPGVSITSYEDGQAIHSNNPLIAWTFHDNDVTDVQAAYQVQATNNGWETVELDSGELTGASESYTLQGLADGNWSIRVRTKDNRGAWSEWAYRSLVIDTVAPTLNVVLDKETLWPANNRLVKVTAAVDTGNELSQVELLSITPSAAVDRYESMVQEAEFGTFDTEFKLLAQKAKGKEAQVYTITYRAIDRAGNVTEVSVTVTVPHDQSGNK
ncbi:endoglucanase [Paenibacillus mucilaginosus]|uniref:glycoside hydrolase family 9 protein n=1 Tax=Paenibacillus mucilaginosus TaxID=61624 RepID=UPI003D207A7A